VCHTHGAGVAVPVQPVGSAAAEPSQLVTQVLELTANTGTLLLRDVSPLSVRVLGGYAGQQPLVMCLSMYGGKRQVTRAVVCACWPAPLLHIAIL
jgi:hypothetical protein